MPPLDVARAAGHIRQARGNQPAGARLGDRDRQLSLDSIPPEHFLEGAAVRAVDVQPHDAADLRAAASSAASASTRAAQHAGQVHSI